MAIITGHDINLIPLAASYNDGDFGEQLKQLSTDLFIQLLGKKTNRVNLSAIPWLADVDLLRQLLHKDGISLLTSTADERRIKHLYKAWVSKNGQGRGLHLLRLFLNLMYVQTGKATEITVTQLANSVSRPYPTALKKELTSGSFLTSRILIEMTLTSDSYSVSQISESIKAITSSRFVHMISVKLETINEKSDICKTKTTVNDIGFNRFFLGENDTGSESLLSYFTNGIYVEGVTSESKNRLFNYCPVTLDIKAVQNREFERVIYARLMDKVVLDFSRLGDGKDTQNPTFIHSHLFTKSAAYYSRNWDYSNQEESTGIVKLNSFFSKRTFVKAQIALGDNEKLGDINSRTKKMAWFSTNKPPILGSFNFGDLAELKYQLIEDCTAQTSQAITDNFSQATTVAIRTSVTSLFTCSESDKATLGGMRLGDGKDTQNIRISIDRVFTKSAIYAGQTWSIANWNNNNWAQLRESIQINHKTGVI